MRKHSLSENGGFGRAVESMTKLFLSIQNLKGVGQKRFAVYQKIGVHTPYDLLYYLPRTYRDYREPMPVAETVPDQTAVVRVTIISKRR